MYDRRFTTAWAKTLFASTSILLALPILGVGRAVSSNPYVPINDSHQRIDVVLASVLPPRGGGWSLWKENPAKAHVAKLGEADGQSYAGLVGLSRLPELSSTQEFLELASRQRARDSGDPRYEDILVEEKVFSENGIWVFRFHIKYKDYGATNLPESDGYLIIEDFGASFRHPFETGVAVNVALSQRSRPGDANLNFKQLADEFVNSTKFQRAPQEQ
jgi:hypothetical protein